jgi:hypothetical protein
MHIRTSRAKGTAPTHYHVQVNVTAGATAVAVELAEITDSNTTSGVYTAVTVVPNGPKFRPIMVTIY